MVHFKSLTSALKVSPTSMKSLLMVKEQWKHCLGRLQNIFRNDTAAIHALTSLWVASDCFHMISVAANYSWTEHCTETQASFQLI